MKISAGSIRVVHPLFQEEGDGLRPISALQFQVRQVSWFRFESLNFAWHSRLPRAGSYYTNGLFFGAHLNDVYYAVAGWSEPVARMLNGRGLFELRRMAVAPDAPKNTASRFLKVMTLLIRKERPETRSLISYQDTEVHRGTIYRAAGWQPTSTSKEDDRGWVERHPRRSSVHQTTSAKVRWEKSLV